MLFQASGFDFDTADEFETIVVGTGAVGLTLAVRLARSGKRVALLEAGPEKPRQASQVFFEAATATGHPLPGLHIGRFRNLGGTTAFWGGQLVPFAPIVFEPRPWVTDAHWPIGPEDVAPYFRQAFDILGMSRVQTEDSRIWQALNVRPPPETEEIQPIFTRWTPEPNLAIHFRDAIRSNPNLTVILEAQVGALVIGSGRIEGVELRLPGGSRRQLRAVDVVLANGTIEISRLLLLHDSEGRSTPWSGNRWIGRGFIDHVDCYAGGVDPIDRKRFSDTFDNAYLDGIKYSPKLRLSDAVQRREQMLEISAHFVFNSSMAENIANLKIVVKGLMKGRFKRMSGINPLTLLSTLRFVAPMALRYVRYRRIMNFFDAGIQLRLTAEQSPVRESCITLRNSRDSFDLPEVAVDWRIDPKNLASIARFGEYLKDYLEGNGLARVSLDPRLVARAPTFLANTDDANHQMGGSRMAVSAADGVVDRDCRVFGTPNLYVAGAAIYPASGFANPTFTAIALGQRLAEHLTQHAGDSHATHS